MQNENTATKHYDVVIVGAGISGAILAHQLGSQGKQVLILEAGKENDFSFTSYLEYLDNFYKALAKVPESPYPLNPDAPQPDVLNIQKVTEHIDTDGYFVQMGPLPYGSTYTRVPGGTTMHWLGTCLRMFPQDFKLKSNYGHGLDWPIDYDDLLPYYEMAEREIGVSANVDEQKYLSLKFTLGYEYPMYKIPQSYLDKTIAERVEGMQMDYDGRDYNVFVTSTPQGRNSIPNPNYDNGNGYTPVGAVGNPEMGLRCEGNNSCVPICPVQAKYNATKTLTKALATDNVTLKMQAVASNVLHDPETHQVTGIEYKVYTDPKSPEYTVETVTASKYVLAAHAVENAKLLLQSNLETTSGLVGKNLMDHPVMNTWALMPVRTGSFRGPLSTSGIESLREGEFRKNRSAFRIEIGNDGWNWAQGDPYTIVTDLVDNKNLFGKQLRERINDVVPRQFRLGFLMEQIPEESNCVTISDEYKDQLGNHRPIIHYNLPDYVRKGMQVAMETADQIYRRIGAENFTNYQPSDATYLTYEGVGYEYGGAGHFAGTHIMGTDATNSVVDSYQRSWDYPNLYLNGCGSFPTVGTSNPTLTMTALTFRTAERILQELNEEAITPTTVS